MSQDTTRETRTFNVLLSNRLHVEATLAGLAKRANRKGMPVSLDWSWGSVSTRREHVSREYGCGGLGCEGCAQVTRVVLTLVGERPHFAGWTFAAALTHLDGENLVRSAADVEIPVIYRMRGPVCDHCKAARRRSETYVLTHEDGRVVQVGSTCIADFLGSDEALRVAHGATLLASAYSIGEDGEESFGRVSNERGIEVYLPVVACCVRQLGWRSRTIARDQGGIATADIALTYLTDAEKAKRDGVVVSAEDDQLAQDAFAWAESLSDAAVDAEKGDYLHNLRAVARSGIVSSKSVGIAASMITAYQRHVGRERARAERMARPRLNVHLGKVGDKVTFGLPLQVGKRGKPLKNAPSVLSTEPVVLDFVTGYDSDFGYVTVLKFLTVEGACVVWKSTSSSTEIDRSCVGKRYALSGSVKKHDEYNGQKQTILSRCSTKEVT